MLLIGHTSKKKIRCGNFCASIIYVFIFIHALYFINLITKTKQKALGFKLISEKNSGWPMGLTGDH
jgi:hypothetical protein